MLRGAGCVRAGVLTTLLSALTAGWAGCAPAEQGSPAGTGVAAGPFNVLLIVVDTLGAKHLGPRGSGVPRVSGASFTPHLDRLAGEGVRFDRAFTTAPWTQPAVASLFTSLMPSRHGVRNLMNALPDAAVTLAERFAAAGWATGAVVSHFLIDDTLGFDQGFGVFDKDPITDAGGLTARRVTTRAVRFLEEQEGPFFLFVHYFDPHSLYNHHAEFDRTSAYQGPMRPAMGVWEVRDRRDRLSDADVAYLVGLYEEEIAYTDHHIGRLLDRLEALGHAERTLVVFTADHGEEFMEHGWIGHTRTLYDELVNVPLVFRLPDVILPGVVAAPVSTLDVAPTLLELVLGEADPQAEGMSLVPTLLEDREPPARELFVEVSFDSELGEPERAAQKRAFKTALVLGELKLVHDLEADTWQLFDRAADPAEERDLWGADPGRDERLRARLSAWEAERFDGESAPWSPDVEDAEVLEQLQQLGYVR